MLLTTANIEYAYQREEWQGFGYLGERRAQLANGRDEEVRAADEKALAAANAERLTGEQFFEWLNSRTGRWYGDSMFGNYGDHAEKYLPGTALR